MWATILNTFLAELEQHPDQVFALLQDIIGLLKLLPPAQLSQAVSVLIPPTHTP